MIFIILLIVIIGLYFILNKTSLKKYNKNNLMFCVLIFIIFTVIQGCRANNVGTDTSKYVNIYNIIKNLPWSSVILKEDFNLEIGFGLLMKILSSINLSARFFLIVVAMIINGALSYFVYKNSKNPLLSIIIFMGAEFFTLSFTALRQMLAVVIILNAYTFIKESKFKQAVFLIILASMFHTTALVFLPVVLFKKISVNKKFLIIFVTLLILVQILGFPILEYILGNTYYGRYLNNGTIGEGIVQLLVIIVYTTLGLIIYYKCDKKPEYNTLILIMLTAILIQSLTWKIQLLGRAMWYFYIFNMIYLPNLINEIKGIKQKNILNVVVGGLSVAQYVLFSMDMYNVMPYYFLKGD